jgi:hypothetical protein
MGQGKSTANIGKDIEGAFSSLGKKMNDGWETTKAWGKKAWEDVKNVPVLGTLAKGIEDSPIGTGWKVLGSGIDGAVKAGASLLQGDVKGSLKSLTNAGRNALNNINDDNTYRTLKKIPVLGDAINNTPLLGGYSIGQLSDMGNTALSAVDNITDGDFKGALDNSLKVGQSLASKGFGGQKLQTAVKYGGYAQKGIQGVQTAQRLLGK